MENKDKIVIPTETLREQPEKEIHVPEHHPSESYYKEMARYHAGFNTNYLTPSDSLETLYSRTCRLNRLFIALNRPWVSGSGEIQKACAYYIAHAGLSKKRREAFIHVLGDIAYSVCHLSACSDFIAQMQRYYRNQEKELRQLLNEQKEIEKRRKERLDCINEGEIAYCITIGEDEIYGMTYEQIKELHRTIEIFINLDKVPLDCKIQKQEDDYCISINKSITLFSDEDSFSVSYGVDSYETEIHSVSANFLKRIALTILTFLDKYGEGEGGKIPEIADNQKGTDADIYLGIKQDDRKPLFKTEAYIDKNIMQDDDGEVEIIYNITINEMYASALSFKEFVLLYDKLGDFLKKPAGV